MPTDNAEILRQLNKAREKRAPKPQKPLRKIGLKKQQEQKQEKELLNGDDTFLQKWYKERQKQLTGTCIRCGAHYDKNNLAYAIAATAHVLAKRDNMFPSVSLHPDNYIELGSFCGCHYWFDNFASWEEIALSKIWPVVLEKFLLFNDKIVERERIPEVFLQEIKPKI